MPARNTLFTTIRTEGALLPADLLLRITEGTTLDGLTPESYHRPGEKLNEVINRSWNALQGIWASFRTAQARLPEGDSATTLTRERWLLPLFRELDYGRLPTAPAAEIDGRSYPISHAWEQVPVHLVSYKLDLDKRTPGATGAAAASPHSLLQVFLNRSEGHLWGFVSNGYKLRLLRDNASLTRQAYVEFDLEAMLEGEVYSDFVLLWLLCHQSRLEGERPTDCWLEKWMKVAEEQGTRALDQLREGVEAAITALGLGYLEYPANHALRDRLTSGELKKEDYYRQLLRMVYRLLFLFVAEDRDLLLNPQADSVARERYILYYSTQRLRRMAETFKGTRHPDLFEGLRLVMRLLSGDAAISRSELPFSSDAHPTNTALSQPGASRKEKGLGDEVPSLRHAPQNRPLESAGNEGLGLVPLGSYLFSDGAVTDLIACQIANTHLLDAIRALSLTYDRQAQVYRPVDYKNLGSDELGSIFESLLELHPEINVPARRFALSTAAGNERKTTGSYYTPESLVHALLDSALDPVIESALRGSSASQLPSPKGRRVGDEGYTTPESRLLNLKVCDPACGSGHFLIAAAHRLAKALAYVRTGEEEPPPAAIQEAKRDVISHCIYGVDINPMAVELCKVNLWLEALEPGKPLNFLDHRIQVGNSLLGTTPALMAGGIPDDAFNPIEGDDPKTAAALKKLNKQERKDRVTGQRSLFELVELPADYAELNRQAVALDSMDEDTLEAVRRKEGMYFLLQQNLEAQKARFLADAWCAAFVWDKSPGEPPLTDLTYRRFEEFFRSAKMPEALPTDVQAEEWDVVVRNTLLPADLISPSTRVNELRSRYQFFHWHVAFPDVFSVPEDMQHAENEQTGWHGGFSCVLGNPPWERIKIEEKQWFAQRAPEIANAPNAAARRKAIAELEQQDPYLLQAFAADKRQAEGESHFVRISGLFPYTARGDINTYGLFTELARNIYRDGGQVGIIIPTGIVANMSYADFFNSLIDNHELLSLIGFVNSKKIFSAIKDYIKYGILTLGQADEAEFMFMLLDPIEITDKEKRFRLSPDDFRLLNPNTLTCPIFQTNHDAELTKHLYRNSNVMINHSTGQNDWKISFFSMFHMSNDSNLFHSKPDITLALQPLYEAKFIWHFDHRFSSYENATQQNINEGNLPQLTPEMHADANRLVLARYWVEKKEVEAKFAGVNERLWSVGFRDIASATNERTFICSIIPYVAIGNKIPLLISAIEDIHKILCLLSCINSYVCDYAARQKVVGANLNFFIVEQFPVLPPHTYTQLLLDFIVPRVLELTYTAWDLQPFAQDVGYDGPPFIWDEERRFLLRCELDALYFHLYHISRDDVDYIMETFPIVKRKDEAAHGEYLTKRIILEMYDQMAALPTLSVPAPKDESATYAIPDVSQWVTWLNPPPADPSVAHEGQKA